MNIQNHDIGVCSWSLQPAGMQDLLAKVQQLGLSHIQLALGDLVMLDDKRKHQELVHLRAAGIELTGGMMAFAGEDYSTIERIRQTGGIVPDTEWPVRKRLSIEGAKLAKELGISTITSHVGFIPPPSDARYQPIVSRIRELAGAFAKHGVDLLMETGQGSRPKSFFTSCMIWPAPTSTSISRPGQHDPLERSRRSDRSHQNSSARTSAMSMWKDATPSKQARRGMGRGSAVRNGKGRGTCVSVKAASMQSVMPGHWQSSAKRAMIEWVMWKIAIQALKALADKDDGLLAFTNE